MSRIPAPELEDLDWFPAPLRDALTGVLRVGWESLRLHDVAAPLVLEALDASGTDRIVDLCSGGGGPAVALARALRDRHGRPVQLVLTDKFPNQAAFDRAERELPGVVRAERAPTDATSVPMQLAGVRTIFNALHHLPPDVATRVFADATERRQPILSFELVERSAAGLIGIAMTPMAVFAMAPFVRPVRPMSLALTYGLPLIPAMLAWDGFASCLRAYSVPELEALVAGLDGPGYRFRVERKRVPGTPAYATSVLGLPV